MDAWTVEHDGPSLPVVVDSRRIIALVKTTEDDARLIAAAPTMYEFVASKAASGDNDALNILRMIDGNAKGNEALERGDR